MRTSRLSDTTTPCRDALAILLRLGLRFVLLFVLAWAVLTWPLWSVLVYVGLLILAAGGAAVETWDLRRHRENQTLQPVIIVPAQDIDDDRRADL